MLAGSDGPVESADRAFDLARQIRYPVIIKAVAGDGDRGMRIVRCAPELKNLFRAAKGEALAALRRVAYTSAA